MNGDFIYGSIITIYISGFLFELGLHVPEEPWTTWKGSRPNLGKLNKTEDFIAILDEWNLGVKFELFNPKTRLYE